MRATALDVCEYVYGDSIGPVDATAQFYEANASQCYNYSSHSEYLTHTFFKCKLVSL